MIRKLLAASVVAVLGTWATTAMAVGPARGAFPQCYMWSHVAASEINVPYAPSPAYSFSTNNDVSKNNTVTRTDIGAYTVSCKGVGGGLWGVGGNVQVTAVGGTGNQCQVQNWSSVGPDIKVLVRCYSLGGDPANSQFNLLFIL